MRKRQPAPITIGRKAPPVGITTRTVCEMLGWTVDRLFGHVRRGELPPPDWYGAEMLWPLHYASAVRRDGLYLPGTYPGFPPGCDESIERRRWCLVNGGRDIRYTSREARAAKKAAKRKRGGE